MGEILFFELALIFSNLAAYPVIVTFLRKLDSIYTIYELIQQKSLDNRKCLLTLI